MRGAATVEVRECGEPLVDLRGVAVLRLGRRPARLRLGVVDRLVTAQTLLPAGLRLLVIQGHLPGPPDGPHATGAAVDLTLCTVEGAPLWTGSAPGDARSPFRRLSAPGLDPVAAETRRHLGNAMTGAGLVNYPAAWWHWSYGDPYWARSSGARYARYGPA
ncbi:M15 family metallopeptidase [Streptomyces sp. NPDC048370]|uniref:M15 family metallopeptidase n=1 Tax=Streptomyces sp. NPDC048370 TaxID=3365540 RepID=UPI00371AB5DE